VALLFVCLSLPLYLGDAVDGGNATIRRGLTAAFGIVGVLLLAAAIPFASVPAAVRDEAVPGVALAQAYSGRPLATAVGLVTAASVLALVVAEYVALARLLHWMHRIRPFTATRVIAIPFLAADAVSLVDPERFYTDLLKPSLVALFVSQLVVFAVYPRFRPTPAALALALVGSALACWGVYGALAPGAAS
jgi:hypothetical protein